MEFVGITEKKHTIWVEMYRPTDIESFVGNDQVKEKISKYIKENDPPHILFYGRPGTGKTTLAKIIAKNAECDYIYINASSETSVDVIRNKVTGFAAGIGIKPLKIVILDEFDFMSLNAQAALRNLMESFSKTTRFILTANYHEKILDAIKSRCQLFHIVPPSKKQVAIHVAEILKKENVEFDISNVALLVNSTYPDIRQLINSLQKQSINGKLVIDKESVIESDFKLKLLQILQEGKSKKETFTAVRQFVADNQIADFSEIYRLLYDELDNVFPGNVANAILTISEGQHLDSLVLDKEINFMAVMIKLIDLKFS